MEDITRKCDICGERRPDAEIEVHKVDLSDKYKVPVFRNVKYCADSAKCLEAALLWDERERERR